MTDTIVVSSVPARLGDRLSSVGMLVGRRQVGVPVGVVAPPLGALLPPLPPPPQAVDTQPGSAHCADPLDSISSSPCSVRRFSARRLVSRFRRLVLVTFLPGQRSPVLVHRRSCAGQRCRGSQPLPQQSSSAGAGGGWGMGSGSGRPFSAQHRAQCAPKRPRHGTSPPSPLSSLPLRGPSHPSRASTSMQAKRGRAQAHLALLWRGQAQCGDDEGMAAS